MSTQTERFFSRKSSGSPGHGMRLNHTNFTDMGADTIERPAGGPRSRNPSGTARNRPDRGGASATMVVMDELHRLETLVERRRTNLRLDTERPVPLDLVERLCRLATWAPNHKRTWPWRFAALVGEARARLSDAGAGYGGAPGSAPERGAKARREDRGGPA